MSRILVAFLVSLPGVALAQAPCDATCDHVVDAGARELDGAGLDPGDVVCLRGGETPTLTIHDVHGSAAAPITIRACDAPLRLGGGSATNAMAIRTSSYLRVTGGDDHAIVIFGGASYVMGISVGSCTEHLEVDGVEASGLSYTPYRNLSEDDACPVRTGFSLHDWFIHDVGGEGMFFGANLGASPYRLVNVEVFHNRVERTGMQGIKIGTTVDDAHVFENVVIDAGTRDIAGEDTGITGGPTSWTIERNVVLRTSASCLFASGHDVHVIDNVLIGCGDAGMSTNGMAANRIRVLHNTFVGLGGNALNMWASMPMDSAFVNNLVVDLASGHALGIRDGDAWTVEGNLMLSTAEAGFATTIDIASATYEDVVPPPFLLSDASPAHDTGALAVSDEVPSDVVGTPRDATPDVGAYEIGAPPVDAGMSAPDAAVAADAGTQRDGGVSGDGGVLARDAATPTTPPAASAGGCSVGTRRSSTWLALTLAAVLAAMRRSRRAV
jgi:hypothetical protein